MNNDNAKRWLDISTRALLILGTWSAFTLILIGGMGVIYQYGNLPIVPDANFGLLPHVNIFSSLPHTLIEIGLLVLVIVQVLRVALLFFYYIQLKDKWFVLISGFILVSLLYSLLWNYI